MEEKGSSSSPSSNSRWNPTKEQIAILEALYQGIRTPSAEQIQQIAIKLREFGMTEGKNVFYWFQNHKARQRQKLKQERFSYYRRLLTNGVSIAVTTPVMAHVPHQENAPWLYHPQGCNNDDYVDDDDSNSGLDVNDFETLQLFPLHPTGILEVEKSESSQTCASICHSDQTLADDYDVGGILWLYRQQSGNGVPVTDIAIKMSGVNKKGWKYILESKKKSTETKKVEEPTPA